MMKKDKLFKEIEKILEKYSPYSCPQIYVLDVAFRDFKKKKTTFSKLLSAFYRVKNNLHLNIDYE